jgi:acyl transferase domain-containing protein/enoyl-CoA hydratase/carnithine racemase/acyl carrier protein
MEAMDAVRVIDQGEGVFVLRFNDAAGGNRLTRVLAKALKDALATLASMSGLRVLVIEGGDDVFLCGDRNDLDVAMAEGLYRALNEFPATVVAAMCGSAAGAGFLFASLCDHIVCNRDAEYGYTHTGEGLVPGAAEFNLFAARFGFPEAKDLLYRLPMATARERFGRGWTCRIEAAEAVVDRAHLLARDLAAHAGNALTLLRQQRRSRLAVPLQAWLPGKALDKRMANDAHGDELPEHSDFLAFERPAPGVLLVRIDGQSRDGDALQVVQALESLIDALHVAPIGVGALVLTSVYSGILPAASDDVLLTATHRLHALAQRSKLPIIMALSAETDCRGWLLGQCFDDVVHPEEGVFSVADLASAGPEWIALAAASFASRLGPIAARGMVLATDTYSGKSLKARFKTLDVVPQDQVEPQAIALAAAWAAWPDGVIAELRNTAFAPMSVNADEYSVAPVSTSRAAPGTLNIASPVVQATLDADGIVSVHMSDREAKNLFTAEIVQGLEDVFAQVATNDACKVVVLTGYDRYFATGGTRESLQAIQSGRAQFTDAPVFVSALRCPVPVVACMQGHAVGGGLSLGLFADFALFSAESQYLNPYLRYGFTPGGGATLIVPEILGPDLGNESLCTAQEYAGNELLARNPALAVYPRAEINEQAMAIAQRLVRHPRAMLVALKAYLNRSILDRLDAVFQQEVAMHAQSFVGQSDALERIHAHFGPDAVATPGDASNLTNENDTMATSSLGATAAQPPTRDEIISELRTLLAQELHLQEHEIGESVAFVDLGLDSITGVTWVKKINTRFGTDLHATRVYSHPTLAAMATLVEESLPASTTAAAQSPAPVPAPARAPDTAQPPKQTVAPAAPRVKIAPLTAEVPAQRPSRTDIIGELRTLLAQELHLQEHEIGESVAFVDLGLDSITGVTWVKKINTRFGIDLHATRVYSHPTLAAMATLVEELPPSPTAAAVTSPARAAETPQPQPQPPKQTPAPAAKVALAEMPSDIKRDANTSTEWARLLQARGPLTSLRESPAVRSHARHADEIAIIGMAGQFPQARNVDEYWTNLAEGRLCVGEVPRERWDMAPYYQPGDVVPGKVNAKWMGSLADHDCFDPMFFDISPREALSMDPQQRLFLQTCWHTVEHAGYNPRALSGSRCGVFVGCGYGDYHLLSSELQNSALGFSGNDTSILAARVSYFLNLQGPCLAVETACSSSLVAIAMACDNLVNGTCDAALAGGVGIIATPHLLLKMAQSGMLSPDGRCFTFDQRANGFVPGEAVGAVLMKRVADAERDGDTILGVIRGWGVNQDGKTNGITAPNPDAQARLHQDVHARFGIDPAGIQLVEAHGTGTKLGDPIEVEALKRAFATAAKTADACALGSVKSNIGHCFTAAGIASVIKVVLSLQHRKLVPTINFERLNEHIDLKGSPFYVNDRLREWSAPASGSRMAAVSGFGFGGTNAHLVIGEYVAKTTATTESDALRRFGKLPILLSARTAEQLDAQVQQLLDLVASRGTGIELTELAYTLQIGREAMDERLGVMAGSTDELVQLLRRHISGDSNAGKVFRASVREHRKTMGFLLSDADMREVVIDRLLKQSQLSRLLELWTQGLVVDWNRLYGGVHPKRLGLPGYPFARQRYWIDAASTDEHSAGAAKLHPLLHRNVSTLRQHGYASTFHGTESFLEHPEGGEAGTLPASAFLEMARAAVQQAWDGEACVGWNLTDIAWGDAYVAGPAAPTLSVALLPETDDSIDFEIYSEVDGIERIHCMGRAEVVVDTNANLAAALAGRQVSIDLPDLGLAQDEDVVLHPWLIESVVRAVVQSGAGSVWSGQPVLPASMTALWVSAPCRGPLTAWVEWEADTEHRLSVALFDAQGQLCAKWSGLQMATTTEGALLPLHSNLDTVSAPSIPVPAPALALPAPRLSRADLLRGLRESLAQALFLKPSDIANDKPFIELGLDSIVGVEWINEINKAYGIKLAAARLYDYPCLDELATHLEGEISTVAPAAAVAATVHVTAAPVSVAMPVSVSLPALVKAPAAVSTPRLSRADLLRGLRESLAQALYLKPSDIQNDKPFIELGLDSIVGVEWISEINKAYGIKLTAARLYDYPCLDELASHLEGEIATLAPVPVPTPVPATQPVSVAVAPVSVQVSTPTVSVPRFSRADLLRGLRESLAHALFLKPSDIANDKPFIELGLDSIVGVEWINEINKAYGIKLAAARLYDYPCLDELATHLEGELVMDAPVPAQPVPAPTPASTSASAPQTAQPTVVRMAGRRRLERRSGAKPATARNTAAEGSGRQGSGRIAVVGMSGRYPQANDLTQFWTNLSEGRNAITEVPPSRWDVEKYYDPDPRKEGSIYCKWIGMLDDIESFDPLFFRISPAEAKNMDPQHRMFLEESYHAFEHAGYARQSLSNTKCGVYVGIIGSEYASLVPNSVDITGTNPAIGAARIAYFLNLKGPAISIDTACSASLVAIHLACKALLAHETDMALAGGVSIYLHAETYMGMCKAGMLSPDGQCHTFDDGANGFVPGEGVGAVVLKRLEDAERDNDVIHGVIIGSAINQDGKTNGITAPSVKSQIELERGLYALNDIDPETITYVETHGTGTKLGDPIELEALSTVFRERTQKKHYCALGSVKSNIGHTSGAAGVASVQKVLLCMRHRTLVPSLNVKKENTLFDMDDSPFYVSRTTQAWESGDGMPRRAAVSSFGFSGTNAHLVIEEYVAPAVAASNRSAVPLPVTLSARTADQLRRRARDLLDFIGSNRHNGSLDLAAMAYTLLEGREALDERLALVVQSTDALETGLKAYLDGETDASTWFAGRVQRDEDGLPRTAAGGKLLADSANVVATLAQSWVRGDALTWAMLNVGAKVHRMALPTYPFAAKRYWVDPSVSMNTVVSAPAQQASNQQVSIHHVLTSEPSVPHVSTPQQRTYRVDMVAIAAYARAGDGPVPAAAFLEVARVALAEHTGHAGISVLGEVAWGQPLMPTLNREAHITIFQQQAHQWAFEIHSLVRGAQGVSGEQVHCQGLALAAAPQALPRVDLAALRGRLTAVVRSDDEDRIETLLRGNRELLVCLRQQTQAGVRLFDGRSDQIDAALRSAAWLTSRDAVALRDCALPDALASLREIANGVTPAWRWAWVRVVAGNPRKPEAMVVDIDLCDADGAVALRLEGVTYDRLTAATATGAVGHVLPALPVAQASLPAPATTERRRIALAEVQ